MTKSERQGFFRWLRETKKFAVSTSRTYANTVEHDWQHQDSYARACYLFKQFQREVASATAST